MPDADQSPTDSSPHDPLVAGLHFRGQLPHLKKEARLISSRFGSLTHFPLTKSPV
jgi:hypothetical protein